jgi:hypothetical protein
VERKVEKKVERKVEKKVEKKVERKKVERKKVERSEENFAKTVEKLDAMGLSMLRKSLRKRHP